MFMRMIVGVWVVMAVIMFVCLPGRMFALMLMLVGMHMFMLVRM